MLCVHDSAYFCVGAANAEAVRESLYSTIPNKIQPSCVAMCPLAMASSSVILHHTQVHQQIPADSFLSCDKTSPAQAQPRPIWYCAQCFPLFWHCQIWHCSDSTGVTKLLKITWLLCPRTTDVLQVFCMWRGPQLMHCNARVQPECAIAIVIRGTTPVGEPRHQRTVSSPS